MSESTHIYPTRQEAEGVYIVKDAKGRCMSCGQYVLDNGYDGDFSFMRGVNDEVVSIVLRVPDGNDSSAFLDLPLKPHNPNGWEWDGNLDKPTLSPSIRNRPRMSYDGQKMGWHGWLLQGELISV